MTRYLFLLIALFLLSACGEDGPVLPPENVLNEDQMVEVMLDIQLIEGAYHLEVSSPGIDRPLTRPKDFSDWAGHEAKVSMVKGFDGPRNIRGNLVGIGGETVTIEDNKAGAVSFPLGSIHSAKLVLTDALIAATKPLDTAGADEISEDEEEKADD